MVPEISSAMDRSFCHFGPFFKLLPHFYPTRNLQNPNFEKMKETAGDIIIL